MNLKFRKVRKGSYFADSNDLHIEIDRDPKAGDYLAWVVFITRRSTATDGVLDVKHIYTNFAFGFAEAKQISEEYAEADALLQPVSYELMQERSIAKQNADNEAWAAWFKSYE